MGTFITHKQATQLLHNKFVVVLGDSVQRSIYKDLVLLLQKDHYLSYSQLKTKGEFSFEQDCLVEGGQLGHMNNGTEYKEVRQYCTDHHLVRFYFLTRIFSEYMKTILEDFRQGPDPDVIIISSCVWDISRYGWRSFEAYKENLHVFFREIKDIVPPECLILWNMAMPLGEKIKGGFLVPELNHMAPSLRHDVIEANFYSCHIADAYGFDVLDLHYHFRLSLQHRMPDGIHWDAVAHRRISGLLLHHIADAWGVDLHDPTSTQGEGSTESTGSRGPRGPRGSRTDLPPTGIRVHQDLERNRARPQRSPPRPLQGHQPFGSRDHWVDQPYPGYYPTMDSRFTTGEGFCSGADDRCMRRRRRYRPNSYHPYPHHPPHVPPRHPAYGW